MNAHGNLLAELVKGYPEEYFSWMEELISRTEDDSEEEPEREREYVLKEQVRGDLLPNNFVLSLK